MPLINGGSEVSLEKWKGVFAATLKKVAKDVHPVLEIENEAINYVENLIIELLGHLCALHPHNQEDVENRVLKTFPRPIDQWCVDEGRQAVGKGKKKNPLFLPVDKIHPLLQKEILGYKIEYHVSLYIVAVLEYISADILKLAGNYVRNIRETIITEQHIKVALCADKVLLEMFQSGELETPIKDEPLEERPITHQDIVKEMIISERHYVRSLNMIIRVFRTSFLDAKDLFSEEDVQMIFTNIVDVFEFTVMFLGLLENAIEMGEQDPNIIAPVGECFEDMAEAQAFDVYETYVNGQSTPANKLYRKLGIGGKLAELLAIPDVAQYFESRGHSFKEAVRYVLPRLLAEPITHCLYYFDLIKRLLRTTPSDTERRSLNEALSVLQRLKTILEGISTSGTLKRKNDKKRNSITIKTPLSNLLNLQRNIEGWEGKDIAQICSELAKEGTLSKISKNGRTTERHVFLLDNLIIFCKQNTKHSTTGSFPEYRLKEKVFLRKAELIDVEDTAETKNVIKMIDREGHDPIMIKFKNDGEKEEWMSSIMNIYLKSTLDRILDDILRESEQATPLRLPTVQEYCFAVEDHTDNIVFEEKQNSGGVPVIKGGTLVKLIERLTYHKYSDPSFLKTFLTTYRSFCKPHELLDMLVTRYYIPEPPPTEDDRERIERGELIVREDLKRFRKEYSQPIAMRVLNVIRHWVENHFYDFERDPGLLSKLKNMLESVNGRAVRKWVDSINRIIERKQEDIERTKALTFEKDPPVIEWHLTGDPEKYDILSLHPIEIARQLTIIQSELYRAVKPSELVGTVWTKDDLKHLTSPNLLKLIRHSNTVTYWFMKSILEMTNFEERVAVLSRIVDILMVFQELNNFSGIMQVCSCFESAAINRLQHTFAELSEKRKAAVEAANELSADHHKKYIEKLRSINPPCIPFFGIYLTNILKIEDGNPDFLPNYPEGIINFSKRKKVAEITGEIQQYQNQPYCLATEKTIIEFLENLDPWENLSDKMLEDYFYNSSLAIEPRSCKQVPKFPRKSDINLKSPGIKATSQRNSALGLGTLRKGPLSMLTITEEKEEKKATSPLTPTETTSPLQSPSSSDTDRNSWPSVSDAGENDDAFESNMPKPPMIPPRKPRTKSATDAKTSEKMIRQNSDDEVPLSTPPPRPPKSPHKLNRAATFHSFIRVDLSDAIESSPSSSTNSSDSIQTPPPLPPRPQSTSSTSSTSSSSLMSPRRNLPPSENSIYNLNDNEEVPPGLPPRPPKPR